jgi:hypothetical protein
MRDALSASIAEKPRMKIDTVVPVRRAECRRVARHKHSSDSVLKVAAGGNELIGLFIAILNL